MRSHASRVRGDGLDDLAGRGRTRGSCRRRSPPPVVPIRIMAPAADLVDRRIHASGASPRRIGQIAARFEPIGFSHGLRAARAMGSLAKIERYRFAGPQTGHRRTLPAVFERVERICIAITACRVPVASAPPHSHLKNLTLHGFAAQPLSRDRRLRLPVGLRDDRARRAERRRRVAVPAADGLAERLRRDPRPRRRACSGSARPASQVPAARRYLPGTMVLETSWGTPRRLDHRPRRRC